MKKQAGSGDSKYREESRHVGMGLKNQSLCEIKFGEIVNGSKKGFYGSISNKKKMEENA